MVPTLRADTAIQVQKSSIIYAELPAGRGEFSIQGNMDCPEKMGIFRFEGPGTKKQSPG